MTTGQGGWLTSPESPDIGEDDRVGLPARHARTHLLRAERRIEHVCVHSLLPDVDALRPAVIPAELRLRLHSGISQGACKSMQVRKACSRATHASAFLRLHVESLGLPGCGCRKPSTQCARQIDQRDAPSWSLRAPE
jgi:hypothetical protein